MVQTFMNCLDPTVKLITGYPVKRSDFNRSFISRSNQKHHKYDQTRKIFGVNSEIFIYSEISKFGGLNTNGKR